jgi:predicted ribosomally synthesized peptide with SipW-like signal peptide
MNLKQKVLMTLGTVGVAAAVAGGGSFASFNAQTTNPGNTFATGTLVMSNKVNTATACLSTAAGVGITTNAANCDTLFNLTVKKPGDSGTADLTIKNEGSVAASLLNTFTSGCTAADASGQAYHGTGDPCAAVQIYIQQWDSAAHTTPTACLYGGATVTNTCDFSGASQTLSDFAANYTNSTTGLAVGSGLAAGASDYFTIGVKLPTSADNTYQGRQATVGMTWYMQ